MKYRRVELHNHSTESDGAMTIKELVDYAVENQFGVLAVTDHNTCSGHRKVKEYREEQAYDLGFVEGVEITTFFGHVLVLGLTRMVDFTELNPQFPECFFRKLREHGAVVGIAHPFCVGEPILVGCRFSMEVKNWNYVDYIEIFNTAGPDDFSGNERALAFWESLVLKGYRVAACAGKDLHRRPEREDNFTTFIIEADESLTDQEQVLMAIRRQRTIVSKGPLADADFIEDDRLSIRFDHSNSYLDWNKRFKEYDLTAVVTDSTGSEQFIKIAGRDSITVKMPSGSQSAVIKLYNGTCTFPNLLMAGLPVYRK